MLQLFSVYIVYVEAATDLGFLEGRVTLETRRELRGLEFGLTREFYEFVN